LKILKLIAIILLVSIISCATQTRSLTFSSSLEDRNRENELEIKLEDLANQIVSSMVEGGKSKIAVIEFLDLDGNITEFGKFLAEELITKLFLTKKFNVIERNLLNKVMEEHRLKISGLIEPNAAKELGRILGVDAIVTGTITDFGTSLKINARIISTETGAIFAVAASEIKKDAVVERLMGHITMDQKPGKQLVGRKVSEAEEHKRGLRGEYFNLPPSTYNFDMSLFVDPTTTRIDQIISFNWQKNAPASKVSADYFGVIWKGEIHINITGTYCFHVMADDAARIWIDNKLILERRFDRGGFDQEANVFLKGDKWYVIKIEYLEVSGDAAIALKWRQPGDNIIGEVSSVYLRTK